jgi:rubrerythrin
VEINLLSDLQKKEAEEILKNYKKAYCCKVCGVIFGSDLKEECSLCPICLSKDNLKCGRRKN